MISESPHLILIAGPKGAGKNTALRDSSDVAECVNTDAIAVGPS